MNQLVFRRVLASVGACLALGYGSVAVWFNVDFNRVYFPTASLIDAIAVPSVAAAVIGCFYFLSVLCTGRWAPWKRSG